jgi:hypothetical protein
LKIKYLYVLIYLFGFIAGSTPAMAAGEKVKEKKPQDKGEVFDASTFILDHVADSHGISGQRKTAQRLLFTCR